MTQSVRVGLGARAYDIRIGKGALKDLGAAMRPLLKRPRTVVVTDANVAARHLKAAEESLAAARIAHDAIVLPPGEETKSFHGLENLCDALLAREVERADLIVALGGGVIGDLTGFTAAVLKRGIDFVQVPTTLLAQVDSSVGGKTAINAKAGKNLVGVFHQPRLVVADVGLLDTLPPRELRAGYAEVVKYGLLGDKAFFEWLEANGGDVLSGTGEARTRAVVRSCEMKAAIVARDEREAGERALLNLGHTFGHALEAETGYSDRLIHGEGVAMGCVLAFKLSERMKLCAPGTAARVAAHFASHGMRTRLAEIGLEGRAEALIAHMHHDKKVSGGQLTFVLARGIGDAFVTRDVSMDALRATLDEG